MTRLSTPFLFAAAFFALARAGSAHPGAGIDVAEDGQVYFAQATLGVWKIDQQGRLGRYEGPGWHFLALDPKGGFIGQKWPRFREPLADGVIGFGDSEIRSAGKSPALLCGSSFPIAIGPDGVLYYPDVGQDEQVHIMRLEPHGEPSDYATLPPAVEYTINGKYETVPWIHGLAAAPDGKLYYAEKEAVRRVDRNGKVTTVAEEIKVPGCKLPEGHRGGPILRQLDVAADGTIYAASMACRATLKISQEGKVEVALRAEGIWSPTGVAVLNDDLYVLEVTYEEGKNEGPLDWLPRVRKLAKDGSVSVLAAVRETPKP